MLDGLRFDGGDRELLLRDECQKLCRRANPMRRGFGRVPLLFQMVFESLASGYRFSPASKPFGLSELAAVLPFSI